MIEIIARFMILVWPLGVPLLYALLLRAAWETIRTKTRVTRLSKATSFLHRDYRGDAAYWEPLEMLRKLILTGGVLLLPENFKLLRIMVALTLSIGFLALQSTIKPFKRAEDEFLGMLTHVALVLIYLAVRSPCQRRAPVTQMISPPVSSQSVNIDCVCGPLPAHVRCCSSRRAMSTRRHALSLAWVRMQVAYSSSSFCLARRY